MRFSHFHSFGKINGSSHSVIVKNFHDQIVKSKSFWLWVFGDIDNKFFNQFQLSEYSVKYFALNFFKWESEKPVGRNTINCHGHTVYCIHLHLEIELVKKMEEKILAMQVDQIIGLLKMI